MPLCIGVFAVILFSLLVGLLLGSESWLYCDDVFGRGDMFNVVRNGDPALISSAIHGVFDTTYDSSFESRYGDGSRANSKEFFNSESRLDDVKAVVVLGTQFLPGGVIASIFKERLLRGIRLALLSGALWLIVPCGGEEDCGGIRHFLEGVQAPAEVIFPDDVLQELQLRPRELARQMRNSMMFEKSLWSWLRGGRVIERLAYPFGGGGGGEAVARLGNISSPRLLRYGAFQWILPGLVLGTFGNDTEAFGAMTQQERAVKLLLQRFVDADAYDKEASAKGFRGKKEQWLKNQCLNVVVVSSMYNERYARALFFNEIRRTWKALLASGLSAWRLLRKRRESPLPECVHVLVTSADDTEPSWHLPSPLFVALDERSLPRVFHQASNLAQFFGLYAHTIHLNYRRWFLCLKESLLSYRLLSFFYELFFIVIAHLTEELSAKDFVYTTFDERSEKVQQ